MTMESGYHEPPRSSTSISPKVVVGGVLGLLALVFVLQNTKEGRVDFLFWHVKAPAFLWLVILFAAGVIVGSMFPWLRRRSKEHGD